MDNKHTPAPWYSSPTGNHQGLIIAEPTGINIAVTYSKDDADLISAAPDLLEALELLLEHEGAEGTIELYEARKCAELAIKKARGE